MICDDCFTEIDAYGEWPDGSTRWATTDGSLNVDCREAYDGAHTPARCLNENDDCNGPVELRWPGYGHRSWPRCEFHGEERIERHNDPNSVARYADSDCVPEWFDPAYAGERWEADY